MSSGIPAAEADLSKELYKVPSHAAWFGYNAIHDIERKSVPDFFCGKAQSKTPKVNMLLLRTGGHPGQSCSPINCCKICDFGICCQHQADELLTCIHRNALLQHMFLCIQVVCSCPCSASRHHR